jgi:hypothetical protein
VGSNVVGLRLGLSGTIVGPAIIGADVFDGLVTAAGISKTVGGFLLGCFVGLVDTEGLSNVTGFSKTEEGAVLTEGFTESLSNETGISNIDVG